MSTRLVFLSVALALTGLFLRLPVHAQTPTPTPVQTVEVAGDIVDARYNLSFLRTGLINITQGIPVIGDQVAQWASQFWTTVFVHDLPDLEDKGNWLRRSDPALTPKSVQDVTIDFETEQRKTYTSRLCVPSVNGSQATEQVSNRRIYSDAVPWVNPLVQYGERFNSFIGRYRRGNQDYERPSQIVRLDSARPCDYTDSALDLRDVTFDTQDINQYGAGANAPLITTTYNPLNFLVGRLETIIDGILNIFLQWNTSALVAWILPTERLPWAEQDCHIFGCESGDLTRAPLDAPQKEELTESKGFVLTFKPKVLNYRTNINSAIPNSFTTNTGITQSIETRTYMTKGTHDSLVYLKCSLFPKVKQGEVMGADFQDTECQYTQAEALSCDAYFNNPPVPQTPGGGNGGPIGPPLGYSIPYRNTNCSLSQSNIDTIASSIPAWYPACSGQNNLQSEWQTVQQYAQSYNWNPAFLIALWIEESAGGACQANQMGCIFRNDGTRLPEDSPICEQLACVIEKRYTDPGDFWGFMCGYSGEVRDAQGHCSAFTNNPNFPGNIRLVYTAISDIAGFGSDCRLRTN
jgi:hypothetical protein